MSKLLVTTVCALLTLPVAAIADDDRAPQAHYQQAGWHAPPPYRGGEHHYDHDDGDRYQGHDGDHHDHDGGNRYYGYAPHYSVGPPHYYGAAPRYYAGAPYYYGGGHHHDHDNDDALWAIGGLVLGAVIGHAVEHSSATASTSASSASQHASQCKDSVAYDSDGTPYVKRDCK
jgi:hypothetical protein